MALARLLSLATFTLLFVVVVPTHGQLLEDGIPASLEDLVALDERVQEILPNALESTVAVRVRWNHGSGIIVTEDGIVLTAGHVVGEPGMPAEITLNGGRTVRGITLGLNHRLDSGMIRITDRGPWPFSPMADPHSVDIGEWCVSTGHPGGYEHDRGAVVRMGRVLDNSAWLLQSDCAIIQGDSGGPIFDLDGHVIGIHSRLQWSLSNNFHVPIRTYVESWDRLLAKEEWGSLKGNGPILGVEVRNTRSGCVVRKVMPGLPADQVGIEDEDIIKAINGFRVHEFNDLRAILLDHEVGDDVEVVVKRGRKTLTFAPTLTERD